MAGQHVSWEVHVRFVACESISRLSVLCYMLRTPSQQKTYVCTSAAKNIDLCTADELGHFIFNFPTNKSINDTSIWSATVSFPRKTPAALARTLRPAPMSPVANGSDPTSTTINPSPGGTLIYVEPIQYLVRKTGYYCVGEPYFIAISPNNPLSHPSAIIPFTIQDTLSYPPYNGLVLFRNTFDGKLPATDYPKVNVS